MYKNVINKIKFLKRINLLHVSAPGRNLPGFFQTKEIQILHHNVD